jgi:flagella basal body P-ring formation protein FlgA
MKRFALLALAALCLPPGVAAEPASSDAQIGFVAARSIRARTVIQREDIERSEQPVPGALSDPEAIVGHEAQGWLQSGRPIMPEDIGPPALVERNEIVTMRFRKGMLEITAEGRVLERGPLGARVRVMNLDSRATVNGVVVAPGVVEVR